MRTKKCTGVAGRAFSDGEVSRRNPVISTVHQSCGGTSDGVILPNPGRFIYTRKESLMLRTVLTITAIAGFAMVTIANAQQQPKAAPTDGRQLDAPAILMTVRLIETNGNVTKIIADPTIHAIEGRPFAFRAGEEVEGTTPLLEFGTQLEGSVTTTNSKAFAVALKVTQGQLVDSGDPKTKTVRAQTVDMRTELAPLVTRTIKIDDKISVEVTIQDSTK